MRLLGGELRTISADALWHRAWDNERRASSYLLCFSSFGWTGTSGVPNRHFVATVGEHQSVVTTQADWRAVRLLTVLVCVVVISSGCGARTLPVAPPAARA